MDTVRSVEASIIRDVETLREQFTDTQALYREVCALLFFRYGVTPTANKLYQFVKKGSMSAPAQALAQFWTDLREKSRNRVEHPDLPEEFQALGGELIARLWEVAQRSANESLQACRDQAAQTVTSAQEQAQALERQSAQLQAQLAEREKQLMQARDEMAALNTRYGAEISNLQAQCASIAALREKEREDSQAQRTRLEGRLEQNQVAFASELSELRATMQRSEERSASNEKRLLLELDRERMSSIRHQKQLETLQTQSGERARRDQEQLAMVQQELSQNRQKAVELANELEQTRGDLKATQDEILALRQALSAAQNDARNANERLIDERKRHTMTNTTTETHREGQTRSVRPERNTARRFVRSGSAVKSGSLRERFRRRQGSGGQ